MHAAYQTVGKMVLLHSLNVYNSRLVCSEKPVGRAYIQPKVSRLDSVIQCARRYH